MVAELEQVVRRASHGGLGGEHAMPPEHVNKAKTPTLKALLTFPWVGSCPLETSCLGRANAPGRSLTCPFACHQGAQRLAGQGWPKAIAKRREAPLTREGCARRQRGPDSLHHSGIRGTGPIRDPRKCHKSRNLAGFAPIDGAVHAERCSACTARSKRCMSMSTLT